MRMKAAETSASSAMADWTPLTVVSRSRTTDEIETFISDVSTTSTNIAIASRMASREVLAASSDTGRSLERRSDYAAVGGGGAAGPVGAPGRAGAWRVSHS